ncbi:MAG: VOC family protein [Rhodospirillales bacterium]
MDEQTGANTSVETSGADPSPITVNKIGHLVYEVSDLEKTVKFWTEVMGFELSDRNHLGMAFLRCGTDHHAIALTHSEGPRRRRCRPSGSASGHGGGQCGHAAGGARLAAAARAHHQL